MTDAPWALDSDHLLRQVGSTVNGLTNAEAASRLHAFGRNEVRPQQAMSRVRALASQLRNPLLFVLLFAAGASALTREWTDSVIVLLIVGATIGITASREYSADAAIRALQARIKARTTVVRDGQAAAIPVDEVVVGDIVLLSAGCLVPADAVVLDASDCYVSEAVLTGESFPAEKQAGIVATTAPLRERSNCLFPGTNVRSGTARAVVVATGAATQFGAIAHRLTLRPPETAFDRGIRHFGYLLTSTMLVVVLVVLAVHMLRGRPPIETLLFAVALAVGLSPELLPAILSVNLARGAQTMAQHGVLVRRLNAIENLGSMDILCTDKTGTLTEGVVRIDGTYDWLGRARSEPLALAAINAALATGVHNALDAAILQQESPDLARIEKRAELPFDAMRKRASVVVDSESQLRLIAKGSCDSILDVCRQTADGTYIDAALRQSIEERYRHWSNDGLRVLAVATRTVDSKISYRREDERELTFQGFVTFVDRPKEGITEAIADLSARGVSIKLITGDNRFVARHVARLVGLHSDRVLSGGDLATLHDEALWRLAERTDLFVEVDPNQKERIILSLKKMGHVVGFLGDGVNDAPAMHAADTSLSVEQAADVAREAADFVLLDRHLDVIRRGIEEGRRTFANTLKYLLTTMSANLGNMMSMAAASLVLPFLPLLAGQILLNNFLSDIPAIGLAGDAVDQELIDQPRRWDMQFIGRFMVEFGLLSSVFDVITFTLLLWFFHVSVETFRTG